MADKKQNQNYISVRDVSDSRKDIIRMEAPEPWPDPPLKEEEEKSQASED